MGPLSIQLQTDFFPCDNAEDFPHLLQDKHYDSTILVNILSLCGDVIASIDADVTWKVGDVLERLHEVGECRICKLVNDASELEHWLSLLEAGFRSGVHSVTAVFKTKQSLRDDGLSLQALMSPESECVAVRVANNLKSCGYTGRELRATGFTASELKAYLDTRRNQLEGTISILKKAGFSVQELMSLGYSAWNLRQEGFSLANFWDSGCTWDELAHAGFSAREFLDSGFTLEQLQKLCFSARQLKHAGRLTHELRGIGYTAAQLKIAGYTLAQVKQGGYTLAELKDAGYALWVLFRSGFGFMELTAVGFSQNELLAAGLALGAAER